MNVFLRLLMLSMIAALSSSLRAEDWPQWRGPEGTGVSGEKNLPIIWNEARGVMWKCPLPQWGTSTPAIAGDAVFVTSNTEDGKLLVLRINKADGKIVWTKDVGETQAPRRVEKIERGQQSFHHLHNFASPSPVTDGKTVVVHFGNGLLAALDFHGNLLWKRNLQEDHGNYTIWWGHANSPVIVEGVVVSACMQDAVDDVDGVKPAESYLIAHDIRDGHVKWKSTRATKAQAEQYDSYTTPLVTTIEGQTQLIVMGGNQLDGYDPKTGNQLWFLPDLVGGRLVTGPTVAGGVIYTTRGMRGPLLAVKPSGEGELPRRDILWSYETGTPDSCSPVLWNDLLFVVTDDGIARCIDAVHGKVRWTQRLKGQYKASPIAVEGRIFFLNTSGLCTVISAAPRFDKLAENELPDETIASPAVSDGQIFLRGKKFLWCVGK